MPQTAKASSTTAKSRKSSNTQQSKITAEQRSQMIAEAAYYLAEKRDFNGGDPQYDWLEAEVEVDTLLK